MARKWTLKQRYKQLTFWNKVAIWGSVASVIGLLITTLGLGLAVFSTNTRIIQATTQANQSQRHSDVDAAHSLSSTKVLRPVDVASKLRSLEPSEREAYFEKHYQGKLLRAYGTITAKASASALVDAELAVLTGLTLTFLDDDGVPLFVSFDEKNRDFVMKISSETDGADAVEGIMDGCIFQGGQSISISDANLNVLRVPFFTDKHPYFIYIRQGAFPEIAVFPQR